LSITALFLLLLAATGWCGGPVAPSGPQAVPFAPGAPSSAPTQTAFNLSGGVGSGNANGVDTTSPWVNLASIGIKDAFAWNVRGTYTPVRYLPNVRIGLDYMNVKFTGSTSNYSNSGAWHPILVNGQGAEGKLDLGIWSLTGDWLPYMVNNAVTIGPRIQWMLLNDRFELTNTTTNASGVGTKTASMFGIGFAGKIDFARLAGGGGGMIDPYIKFAASVGQGAKVRYYSYEIFLSIFKGDGIYNTESSGFWRYPRLGVGVDLGYVHYGFASHDEDNEFYAAAPPGANIRPNNLRYDLGVPYIRGTVTF
jgi:hypothetical protein